MTRFEWVVEFAPGFYPFSEPAETDWVTLGTGEAVSVDYQRGKQDDRGEYEAGVMNLVLDNADESLDQLLSTSDIYDTAALPDTPVRLVAVRGPLRKVMFTGYTLDGFAPSGLRGGGTVSVTVVDWMGWAEQIETPDCEFAAWVAYNQPSVWMRGICDRTTFAGGSGTAFNMARTTSADWAHDGSHASYAARWNAAMVPGKSQLPLYFGAGASNGGISMPLGSPLAQEEAWSVCLWIQNDDAASFTVGTALWSVAMNGSGHIVASVTVGGVGHSSTIAVDHSDNNGHVITLEVRSGGSGTRRMRLTSDLGTATTSIGASDVSGGGAIQIYGLGFCIVDEFAYFSDVDTLDFGLTHANWLTSWEYLWGADDAAERLDHHLRAAGLSTLPVLDIDVDASFVPSLGYGFDGVSTLADAIRQCAAFGLGGAWVKRDGSVRVRDYLFTADEDDTASYSAVITDDGTNADWTRTGSDAFTRANATSLGATWSLDISVLSGGSIGIISNTAFVNAASSVAALPAHSYREPWRDVDVSVDITGHVDGQGVFVRRNFSDGVWPNLLAVVAGTATVEVISYIGGVATVIGNTGADDLDGTLNVTVHNTTLTVQIDAGTVHEFEITDTELMTGAGVGLIYTGTTTPANTARWDNWSTSNTRDTIRAVDRSRTGTRKDRIVNALTIEAGTPAYSQDKASLIRYGFRRQTINSRSASSSAVYADEAATLVAARKDPPVEVGELTLELWVDQEAADWFVLDCELDRPVVYREALYRAGTEVIDANYRVQSEALQITNGVEQFARLKIAPA